MPHKLSPKPEPLLRYWASFRDAMWDLDVSRLCERVHWWASLTGLPLGFSDIPCVSLCLSGQPHHRQRGRSLCVSQSLPVDGSGVGMSLLASMGTGLSWRKEGGLDCVKPPRMPLSVPSLDTMDPAFPHPYIPVFASVQYLCVYLTHRSTKCLGSLTVHRAHVRRASPALLIFDRTSRLELQPPAHPTPSSE